MRGVVWRRVLRPCIGLAPSIILVVIFLSRGTGFAGNGPFNVRKLPPQPNFPEKVIQSELSRTSSRAQGAYIVETSRIVRHLVEVVGEDERALKGKDAVLHLSTEESKYGGEALEHSSPESGSGFQNEIPVEKDTKGSSCTNPRQHPGYKDSCSYVRETPECKSGTLIEYTEVFYCLFSGAPILAYAALTLLLLALFYTLGHTANHFFCVSMHNLSQHLEMSSTLAGVTLLPFGNGAPDVFASVVSFVGHSGQAQVGLNSVLGGAMFVSSVVAGSVTLMMIAIGSHVELDRRSFLRDVAFFLISLTALTAILYDGKVHFWEALVYISIYAVYVVTVAAVEYLTWRRNQSTHSLRLPLLTGRSDGESGNFVEVQTVSSSVQTSLLQQKLAPHEDNIDNSKDVSSASEISLQRRNLAPHEDNIDNPKVVSSVSETSLPARNLAPNRAIETQPSLIPILTLLNEPEGEVVNCVTLRRFFTYFIQWPLTIPRRLTIPLIEDAPRWSKFYAVCSATFAPLLLAMVWDGKDGGPFGSARAEYIVAGSVGIVLGCLSLIFLKQDRPPQRLKVLWAAGGFTMSMVWFYVIAMEIVAALVALGAVLEIDPAILGLTVLAWGNSTGDMMSNLALVSHGDHRMQTSFSGCYAGPMFNTLVGIGISFLLASWETYPNPFVIPEDASLLITVAFLVVVLVWPLVMLLSRDMKPTKPFGVGLLILYFSFLSTRVAYALDIQSYLLTGGRS